MNRSTTEERAAREQTVRTLRAQGMRVKEIAQKMCMPVWMVSRDLHPSRHVPSLRQLAEARKNTPGRDA